MRPRPGLLAALGCSASLTCEAEDPPPLPIPTVAITSEHIAYSTWENASMLCMDDRLEALDHFLEGTASELMVDLPPAPIRYIFTPYNLIKPSTWPCNEGASGCYVTWDNRGFAYANLPDHTHELVHALDVPNHRDDHFVFIEGVAEYFGTATRSDRILATFPDQFKGVITGEGRREDRYAASMHYVGTLIERSGIEKLDRIRGLVAADTDLEAFAAAHKDVYGESLDDALLAMSSTPIRGRHQAWGCVERPPAIPWPNPDLLEASLHGECGDGWSVNGGADWLTRLFAINVDRAGIYRLTVLTPEDALVAITACADIDQPSGLAAMPGGQGVLQAGSHVLSASAPGPAVDVTFTLEYLFPPP